MATTTTRSSSSLLSAEGRASRPFRSRVRAAIATIAVLHVVGVGLLVAGLASPAGIPSIGLAVFAYVRGLMHSFDVDHISVIDNSTRKFIAEGRRPASVGLAFSAGHSTMVVLIGVLVIAGVDVFKRLLNDQSSAGHALAIAGLAVSSSYLLLIAIANLASFLAALRLRRELRQDHTRPVPPGALMPRGLASRIMTAPLRRVRHPRHIFLIGFLFSLGFDSSSQIGLLMITAAAALAGAAPVSLLALPVFFAAAMTLGDTCNGLMMLKMYETAIEHPVRRITFNLVITGISITSAAVVGTLALSELLNELGLKGGPIETLAGIDTAYAGYALVATFAVIGLIALLRWRWANRKAAVTSLEDAHRGR